MVVKFTKQRIVVLNTVVGQPKRCQNDNLIFSLKLTNVLKYLGL